MHMYVYINTIDGRKEQVLFDKITSRINKLCANLDSKFIDPPQIAQKVIKLLFFIVCRVNLYCTTPFSPPPLFFIYYYYTKEQQINKEKKANSELYILGRDRHVPRDYYC